MSPGVYVTTSADAAFGHLLGLVREGRARVRGDHYLPTGAREIVVEVLGEEEADYTPNEPPPGEESGTLLMGPEFFKSAIDDYRNWREGWWREAVQNAVDAGASRVSCSAVEQPDGTWIISCEDNGAGMDKETLRNVFMRLKGTGKKAGGTTGGFGEAKRLLVLPWLSYEMHTRDVLMRGSGADYKTYPTDFKQGTRLTVVMPADNHTTADAAEAYIAKCQLPGVRFTVNDKTVKANLATGDKIRDLESIAALYYDKRPAKFDGLVVRMRDAERGSLSMFVKYIPSAVKGQLILEIFARSTEVLTSNRDGFRGEWESIGRRLENAIDQYVTELAADVSSALRKKQGLVKEKFLGTGKFEARERESTILSLLGSLEPQGAAVGKGAHELSEGQQAAIVDQLTAESEPAKTTVFVDEDGRPVGGFRATAEVAAVMLDGLAVKGSEHVEAMVAQLAWEPDFYLINEIEGYKVPKKFYPQSMTSGLRKLLRCWAELCRFVLIQLGSKEKYGVGFIMDADVGAAYQNDDGHWLMLNPFQKSNPVVDDSVWSISDWEDMQWLYAAAVHECTHMADGIEYHNESFASALTRNFARTSGKEKQIRAIKRIVLAEEKKLKEKLPKRERKARASSGSSERRKGRPREFSWTPGGNLNMTGGYPLETVRGEPEYYGNLKGVLLYDQDAGVVSVEVANTATYQLYRMPASRDADSEALIKLLHEAYGATDTQEYLMNLSDEHADLSDQRRPFFEVLADRWVLKG